MTVKHYSLNGEKTPSRLREFFRYKMRLALYAPISYLLILLHILLSKKKKFKYKASLCLIFKDEGHYLKEWIEYHKLIGIDHFYLYNNNSTDNYKEILAPYIKDGLVTLIEFPEKYAQVKAYRECYNAVKNETEWLGFIDTDEYINIIKHDNIKDLLESVRKYPSLNLNWKMFGTSGHLHEDFSALTIERYTQSWDKLSSTAKGFINNNFDNHYITSVHFHSTKFLRLPILGVAVNKSIFRNLYTLFTCNIDKIAYLNHYWSRSYEFYHYKDFIKGDATNAANEKARKSVARFERHELRNKTKDFSIQRWLVLLKLRMKD